MLFQLRSRDPLFGSFVLGMVLGTDHPKEEQLAADLEGLSRAFLIEWAQFRYGTEWLPPDNEICNVASLLGEDSATRDQQSIADLALLSASDCLTSPSYCWRRLKAGKELSVLSANATTLRSVKPAGQDSISGQSVCLVDLVDPPPMRSSMENPRWRCRGCTPT